STGLISETVGNQAADGSPYSVIVRAMDGHNTGSSTFTWNVADITMPSITSSGTQSSNEGTSISLSISASDSDSDTLTYSATSLLPDVLINSSTGLISGTVGNQAADGSPYSVTVKATDGHNTGSSTFTWNVADITTPSITSPGTQNSDEA